MNPILILIFCIIGCILTWAMKSALSEASNVGNKLLEESREAKRELKNLMDHAENVTKLPEQVIITEQYEPSSSGRQVTEYELREMIYGGIGLVLDKKMDAAEVAIKLSEEMKKKLDVRVKTT